MSTKEMAQKMQTKKTAKNTNTKKTVKNTKASNVIVNGHRSTGRQRTMFGLRNVSTQKILALLGAVIVGGLGVYLLVRSQAATPTADSSTFTATTWNSYYGNKTNVGTSIKKLGANSDIIGIQEAHKPAQRKNIKKALLCSDCKYQGYVQNYTYDGSSAASLPILWNKSKFKLVEKGYVKTSDTKKDIKDTTGNNAKVSAKYITWVRLRDKATGRSFYVANLHTVASVEAGGSPNTKNKTRLTIYKKGMDALVKKLKSFKEKDRPIIVLGDFNVNYRYDIVKKNAAFPYARLSAIGMYSTYQQKGTVASNPSLGSQGNGSSRLIDYVFTLRHNRMTVNNEYMDGSTYGSDHRPVSATLTLYETVPSVKPLTTPAGTTNLPATEGVVDEQRAIEADAYLGTQ